MKYDEWVKTLEDATKNEPNEYEHMRMRRQATRWTSCAVGAKLMCDLKLDKLEDENQIQSYIVDNLPSHIQNLGSDTFPMQIRCGLYSKALDTLHEIYNTKDIHKSWLKKVKFRIDQYLS